MYLSMGKHFTGLAQAESYPRQRVQKNFRAFNPLAVGALKTKKEKYKLNREETKN